MNAINPKLKISSTRYSEYMIDKVIKVVVKSYFIL